MKKIFIIDSFNILYRAFYGIKAMRTSRGFCVNALYGFCKILLKIIREQKPDAIYAVWEGGFSKRSAVYQEYKKNRQLPPDDLSPQRDYVLELLSSAGIPVIMLQDYEADDIAAYLAQKVSCDGYKAVIVSGDKDFHQLLSDSIVQYDPSNHSFVTKEDLVQIYGFIPSREQILLYYSLVGDASDNVPGVKGIGDKTARIIMLRYSSLDDVYNRYESDPDITPSVKRLLSAGRESAYMSHFLVSPLHVDDCLIKKVEQWSFDAHEQSFYDFFVRYELFSLLPSNYKKNSN